ncbi:hypothetical protein [Nonomuraea insulae]|uniref:EamA domain-containing protein n=1 Tax=Nonomuraea insulae TaxID=1616787 RepID=A0ABW1CVH0_9ACTN
MPLNGPRAVLSAAPPWTYFIGSAVFLYLGPAFAVLLFTRLAPLGVAVLRIWSAALVLALWRRPWRTLARLDAGGRRTIIAWGAVLAAMNICFYLAIARMPLGTVAAMLVACVFVAPVAVRQAARRGDRGGICSSVIPLSVALHRELRPVKNALPQEGKTTCDT